LRLQCLSVANLFDAYRHGLLFGHLRGAIAPRTSHDLIAVFGEWPDKQGRQNALAADGVGQFFKARLIKRAAWVGL
jgi:hypothetical protein